MRRPITAKHRTALRKIQIIFLSLMSMFATLPAQTFNAQVRDGTYIELHWHDVGNEVELARRLPGEIDYTSMGIQTGNILRDTLHRSVCGDTIRYRLRYQTSLFLETAVWFSDNLPPQYTDIQIVTVDSLADSIVVRWTPSESPDVAAYIVCTGTPCVAPDTVKSTRYAIAYKPSPVTFRLFAIDSCGNPSALSDPCNNLQHKVEADGCGGTVTASWNRYINMPYGMGKYILQYSPTKPYQWQAIDSTDNLSMRLQLPDGLADSCFFRVTVCSRSDIGCAFSNPVAIAVTDTINEPCPDTASGQSESVADLFALPNVILYRQPPNDRFQPCLGGQVPPGVEGYRLDVYCRTGRRVFHSEDPSVPFTGTSDSLELQGGAYVYLLFYSLNGQQKIIKGQLLLLK